MSQIIDGIKYGNRYSYLAKGCIMTLFLGILYAWSIFIAPLEQMFGWERTQTTITYSIMTVAFALGQLTGGFWSGVIKNQARTVTIFSFLLAIGFFMTSFTETLGWLYFWYGGFCGYTLGVTNNCVLSTAPKWFPDRSGFAIGVTVVGFGLSSLILGQLATYLIVNYDVILAMRVLAGLCFVMVTCVSLTFKAPPLGYTPPGFVPSANESSDIATGYTPIQVAKTRKFWLIYLWNFCNHFAALMVVSSIAVYGIQMGMDPALAALCMGVYGVSNACGRPIFGAIGDKIGRVPTFIILSCIMGAGLALLAVLPGMMDPFVGTLLAAIVIGISFGGNVSTKCSSMRTYFGSKHVSTNIGMVSSNDLFAGVLGPMLAATIFAATGEYYVAFLIAAVVAVAGIVFALFVGKPVPVAECFPESATEEK